MTHTCTRCPLRFTPKCVPCVQKTGVRCPACGAPGRLLPRSLPRR